MNTLEIYRNLCKKYHIPHEEISSLLSYDDSTLFCPAGMQKYKGDFLTKTGETLANVQKCLRLNDLDEIGDGIHALSFDMIGLFSFRDWSVARTICFFLEYLENLGLKPDYVTVHPDKESWEHWYPIDIEVKTSDDCLWTDGKIGGYCTEFFIYDKNNNPVEVGNIVNPLGHSIDVGFGRERLKYILGAPVLTDVQQLQKAALDIINSGVKPSAKEHGYILRKILRELYLKGGVLEHEYFEVVIEDKMSCLFTKLNLLCCVSNSMDKSEIIIRDRETHEDKSLRGVTGVAELKQKVKELNIVLDANVLNF